MIIFGETLDFSIGDYIASNPNATSDEIYNHIKSIYPQSDEMMVKKTIWARVFEHLSDDTYDGTIVSLYLMSDINSTYEDIKYAVDQTNNELLVPNQLMSMYRHHSDTFFEKNGVPTNLSDEEVISLLESNPSPYVISYDSNLYTLGYYTINGCHKVNTAIILNRELEVRVIYVSNPIMTSRHSNKLPINSGDATNNYAINAKYLRLSELSKQLEAKNAELFGDNTINENPNNDLLLEISRISNEIVELTNEIKELQK